LVETDLFKWRHYKSEIILLCVRWHLRSALSYRDLEEMMNELIAGRFWVRFSIASCCSKARFSRAKLH
jgi:hypothetical protein